MKTQILWHNKIFCGVQLETGFNTKSSVYIESPYTIIQIILVLFGLIQFLMFDLPFLKKMVLWHDSSKEGYFYKGKSFNSLKEFYNQF